MAQYSVYFKVDRCLSVHIGTHHLGVLKSTCRFF